MGTECSLDSKLDMNYNQFEKEKSENYLMEEQNIYCHLTVKNIKDYYKKFEIFKKKLNEIVKKIEVINDFSIKKE